MKQIGIIGSGAWGTALAQVIAAKGQNVTLWARRAELAAIINDKRENTENLPGIPLHNNIRATAHLKEAASDAEILLLVPPAQSLREILQNLKPYVQKNTALVLSSKGIELKTGLMMSEVAHEILPQNPLCILSGPNFAREIAAGQPAATTLACLDNILAKKIQSTIGSPYFRPYITDDLTGVQIAGALKNVIAIACGIAQGLGFGESTRASLVTRGMAEIVRLGTAMGARTETFLGLSGMGDLMLTCSSTQSRNFSLGVALGQGKNLEDIQKKSHAVTEGVHTAQAALSLAARHNREMPVTKSVNQCLNEGRKLDDALKDMLNRPFGNE